MITSYWKWISKIKVYHQKTMKETCRNIKDSCKDLAQTTCTFIHIFNLFLSKPTSEVTFWVTLWSSGVSLWTWAGWQCSSHRKGRTVRQPEGSKIPQQMRTYSGPSTSHTVRIFTSERISLGVITNVYIYGTVSVSSGYNGMTTIILGAEIFRNKL